MKTNQVTTNIKKSWNWVWHSDSPLSWIVALLLIFILVKFIFFPTLSLIFGTTLPLAGVESSSMDHQIVKDSSGRYTLCTETFSQSEITHQDFDDYWDVCEDWYEHNNITKNEFENFPLNNGFRKGDILIVWGRFTPEIGDVVIFQPNPEAYSQKPIVHRIVKIEDNIIQTKGDHNAEQLTPSNNNLNTDETHITQEQIIGKAVFKIPYLGWVKIWFAEFISKFI